MSRHRQHVQRIQAGDKPKLALKRAHEESLEKSLRDLTDSETERWTQIYW